MEHLGKQQHTLQNIDPTKIKLNDDKAENSIFRNARTTLNKDEMATIRESIRKLGLLKPIIVRPLANDPDGYPYQLVCGSRRLRNVLRLRQEAISILKEKRPFKPEELCFCPESAEWHPATEVYQGIKCFVRDCDDEMAIAINIAENLEHSKVPEMDLMEFCQELVDLKDKNGKPRFTRAKIADMCNRSESWVSLTLELNQLPESVKQLLAENRITRTAALAFLQTERDKIDQVIEAGEQIVRQKKLLEASEAAEEMRIAEIELSDAHNDVMLHEIMGNDDLREMAERRENSHRKRVSAASEKHDTAVKAAERPNLTAEVIHEANLLVPDAKKGKPKAMSGGKIRALYEKFTETKKVKMDIKEAVARKAFEKLFEVILGQKACPDVESLLRESYDCVVIEDGVPVEIIEVK